MFLQGGIISQYSEDKILKLNSNVSKFCANIDAMINLIYDRRDDELAEYIDLYDRRKNELYTAIREYNKEHNTTFIFASPGNLLPPPTKKYQQKVVDAVRKISNIIRKYDTEVLDAIKQSNDYAELCKAKSMADEHNGRITHDELVYGSYLKFVMDLDERGVVKDWQMGMFTMITSKEDAYLIESVNWYKGKAYYRRKANKILKKQKELELKREQQWQEKCKLARKKAKLAKKLKRDQEALKDVLYLMYNSPIHEMDPWGADASRACAEEALKIEVFRYGCFDCEVI